MFPFFGSPALNDWLFTTGKGIQVNTAVKYLSIHFSRNENSDCYSILRNT